MFSSLAPDETCCPQRPSPRHRAQGEAGTLLARHLLPSEPASAIAPGAFNGAAMTHPAPSPRSPSSPGIPAPPPTPQTSGVAPLCGCRREPGSPERRPHPADSPARGWAPGHSGAEEDLPPPASPSRPLPAASLSSSPGLEGLLIRPPPSHPGAPALGWKEEERWGGNRATGAPLSCPEDRALLGGGQATA